MRNAYMSGVGHHLPPRVVTNQDLQDTYGIETTGDWIVKRTGIEERRFADEGVGSVELAIPAAQAAVADAGLELGDVEMVVFATLSPQHGFPGNAVYLNHALGLKGVPALDVRNQCSGFLYALATASSMVKAGMYRHVLVVGSECHSAALDLTTRGRTVASLFGDGAGAAVVSATDEPRGISQLYLGADGEYADVLCQPIWDIRKRPFFDLDADGVAHVPPDKLWATMNGKLVFKNAVEKLIGSLLQVCWNEGISPQDLDMVFFHQANMRINQYVQQQLGLPEDKVPHNIARYGNTTAATLPILLSEAKQEGRLRPGMKIGLAAFGSGFTWGAAIATW